MMKTAFDPCGAGCEKIREEAAAERMTEKEVIRIGKPRVTKTGDGRVRLCAEVTIQGRTAELWYSVEERYEDALVKDRSDPFAALLVRIGMQTGADLISDAPVSKRLLYRLNHSYIPALAFAFSDLKAVRVAAEPAGPCKTKGATGCGCTFGVDSLYTILQNGRGEYPVTHLCLFNAGTFEGEAGRAMFRRHYEFVQAYARQRGLDSLSVDTNLPEGLGKLGFAVPAPRFFSAVLALQGLFGTYHYASTFRDEQFRFTRDREAYDDPLTVSCFTTDSLRFFLSGASVSRIEKLAAIADEPAEAARLHPCGRRPAWEKNCSRCMKCIRDMMVIRAARKTDRFAGAFEFDRLESSLQAMPASALGEGDDVLMAEAAEYWKRQGLLLPGES